MRLVLNNLAKVNKASIEIDGLTVIAGKNNTGKSTVGKSLYAYFYSLKNLDQKIIDVKFDSFLESFSNSSTSSMLGQLQNYSDRRIFLRLLSEVSFDFNRKLFQKNVEMDNIARKIIEDRCRQYNRIDWFDYLYKAYSDAIESSNKFGDITLAKSVIGNIFNKLFNGQICNINGTENASVTVHLKGVEGKIEIDRNSIAISFPDSLIIQHDAFFIDNPLILNNIAYDRTYNKEIALYYDQILRCINNDNADSSVEAIKVKEKINDIIKSINDIVAGDFINDNGRLMFKENDNSKPTELANLSSGLKAFVLIKRLLENGAIREKDVLILDEPEIHLHSEWLIKYAQIIVLLQKVFDLNIVITTHSRDFLEAIDLYAEKYDIKDKCNYYVSRLHNGNVEFDNTNKNLAELYRQLLYPTKILDELRSELRSE